VTLIAANTDIFRKKNTGYPILRMFPSLYPEDS
jgi:hypothetical protein